MATAVSDRVNPVSLARRFNHAICMPCWRLTEGDRIPARLKDPQEQTCCFCLRPCASGIFVRRKPEYLPCQGDHD